MIILLYAFKIPVIQIDPTGKEGGNMDHIPWRIFDL